MTHSSTVESRAASHAEVVSLDEDAGDRGAHRLADRPRDVQPCVVRSASSRCVVGTPALGPHRHGGREIHIASFAERVALTPAQVRATVHGGPDDPAWADEERLLIRLVDELHDAAGISDELWAALAAVFSVDQILELIALVGFHHLVSFFANGLQLPLESYGAPFPPRG